MQELRKTESSLRTERDQFRDQATANKHEVEKLRGIFNFVSLEIWLFLTCVPFVVDNFFYFLFYSGDISKQFSDADEVKAELAKVACQK